VHILIQWNRNNYCIHYEHDYSLLLVSIKYAWAIFLMWTIWKFNIIANNPIKSTLFCKILLNMKYVFRISLYKYVWKYLILRRSEWPMFKTVYCSLRNVPVIVVITRWNFNFLAEFWKNLQISNLVEILLVEQFSFMEHTDGQRDKEKLSS
jgi:hypothetical protein